MSERRDETPASSAADARPAAKPPSGKETGLPDKTDEALARDDLPKDERIDHQNDLA